LFIGIVLGILVGSHNLVIIL